MLLFFKNLLVKPGPRYSWRRVFLTLFASSFVAIGLFIGCYFLKNSFQHSKSSTIPIRRIAQTGLKSFQLNCEFLAEVLDISIDQPKPLLQFDLKEAKKKLYGTHLIKKARLKKIKPDILFINYELREPIAFFEDLTNTAIDEEGCLFPYAPFYSSKNLPKLYLGEIDPSRSWGEKLKKEHIDLVLDLFRYFDPKKIKQIDLSQIYADSYGRREIVLFLQSERFLRLTLKNYPQELARYFILENSVLKNESCGWVIDLRWQDVAYIDKR